MPNPKTNKRLPPKKTIFRMLSELELPEDIKTKLRRLYHRARHLVVSIVQFLYNKRHFCSYLLLGVILFYLLSTVPMVGPLLASLAISLSLLAGIYKQFEADIRDSLALPA